jgi:ketosteroid isomerase-like protein
MTVMMISEVSGQSPQGYDGMLAVVGGALQQAPGFVMHMAHPAETGWRIVEVWRSREDATRFFAAHIAPHLPEGVRPKLSFQPLHSLVGDCAAAPAEPAIDRVVAELVRRSAEAHGALMRGDVDRCRALIKYTDDFTLMSPFGGTPTRGADMTDERWEAMGRFFRNGVFEQEVVQAYGSADMVVLVLIERQTVEVGGLPAQSWPLRVTLVYRREGSEWHLAHRHADPLVGGITLDHAAALARGEAGTVQS